MDFSSWFRKALLKKPKPETTTDSPNNSKPKPGKKEGEDAAAAEMGLTDELRDFVKSFTLETFKSFPLQDDQGTITDGSATNSEIVSKDLSEWQERHAMLVLTNVKEISQLRYSLCPRHLKERQFWRIYFALVKSYVAPYELQAIRLAKVKRMGKEEKSLDNAYEVEMSETKRPPSISPPFLENKSANVLCDAGCEDVREGAPSDTRN